MEEAGLQKITDGPGGFEREHVVQDALPSVPLNGLFGLGHKDQRDGGNPR